MENLKSTTSLDDDGVLVSAPLVFPSPLKPMRRKSDPVLQWYQSNIRRKAAELRIEGHNDEEAIHTLYAENEWVQKYMNKQRECDGHEAKTLLSIVRVELSNSNTCDMRTNVWNVDASDSQHLCELSTQLQKQSKKKGRKSRNTKRNNLTQAEAIGNHLSEAWQMALRLGIPQLSYDVCHCAADFYGRSQPLATAYFLQSAFAISARHEWCSLPRNIEEHYEDELVSAMKDMKIDNNNSNTTRSFMHFIPSAVDDFQHFCDTLLPSLPSHWVVCSLSLSSDTNHMYICRMNSDHEPIVGRVSLHRTVRTPVTPPQPKPQTRTRRSRRQKHRNNEEHTVEFRESTLHTYTVLMNDFNSIIQRNKETSTQGKQANSKALRRQWWKDRQDIDVQLGSVINRMQDELLGFWSCLLYPITNNNESEKFTSEVVNHMSESCGIDTRNIDTNLLTLLVSCAHHLSRASVIEGLTYILDWSQELSDDQSATLETLCDIVTRESPPHDCTATTNSPLILIVGKELQQLPWENMTVLKDQTVCRIPSIHFLMHRLNNAATQQMVVDIDNSGYILNPGDDLPETQEHFEELFQSQENWSGIVQRAPSKEEFIQCLTERDLLFYCGHSGGEQYLPFDDLKNIEVRATTLLMGCSSGLLKYDGKYDATGTVMAYMLANCPAVVANLWDVTDRDCNRFFDGMLENMLDAANSNEDDGNACVAATIPQARERCKLRWIVGGAPVYYGIPVNVS